MECWTRTRQGCSTSPMSAHLLSWASVLGPESMMWRCNSQRPHQTRPRSLVVMSRRVSLPESKPSDQAPMPVAEASTFSHLATPSSPYRPGAQTRGARGACQEPVCVKDVGGVIGGMLGSCTRTWGSTLKVRARQGRPAAWDSSPHFSCAWAGRRREYPRREFHPAAAPTSAGGREHHRLGSHAARLNHHPRESGGDRPACDRRLGTWRTTRLHLPDTQRPDRGQRPLDGRRATGRQSNQIVGPLLSQLWVK